MKKKEVTRIVAVLMTGIMMAGSLQDVETIQPMWQVRKLIKRVT